MRQENLAGGTNISFLNHYSRRLFIYYKVVQTGSTIECEELSYDGILATQQSKTYFVPNGYIGWFKFQLQTDDGGCGTRYNKTESWIEGRGDYVEDTITIN